MEIRVTINGEKRRLRARPGDVLLDVLRREGYKGVKRGCGLGQCGCCTILLDGRAVKSCILLAGQAQERTITTIEGLGNALDPHPLQTAFVDAGAVQCGYCTPGMILSAKALLDRNPSPAEEEVEEALSGNLCRCTGYVKPIEAVLTVARGRAGKEGGER